MPTKSPTTENGRTIAGMYEAFGRGDVEQVVAQIAPEVEWIESDAKGMPARGRFSTPQEVLEGVFASVPQNFERFKLLPEHWIETDDDVVVTGRVEARTRAGTDLNAPFAHVFTLRHGKVTRNDNFHDTALWVEALR
ncbi:MAG: uncharacterized protein QOJ01_717 [Solirubrobacterales bacterium]|nr:uncharacterized protein [Solirubrobacterales bacterium]